jgi:hypothetical protein
MTYPSIFRKIGLQAMATLRQFILLESAGVPPPAKQISIAHAQVIGRGLSADMAAGFVPARCRERSLRAW